MEMKTTYVTAIYDYDCRRASDPGNKERTD